MSRQTVILAYISVVGLEICYVAGIGANLYFYSKGYHECLFGAIFIGILALVFNCMLYCYKDKLKVAIAVIDAAADYYAATKRMILVSIFYFVLQIAFFVGFGASFAMLFSMNPRIYDAQFSDDSIDCVMCN